NPHLWKPQTKSVAVFKNGFAFFLRQGEARPRDGWVTAKDIPPATFGTFAVFSNDKDELVDVVGAGPGEIVDFDGIDVPDNIATRRERLNAARWLNVQLTYKSRHEERTAAGKLTSVGPDFVVLEASNSNLAVPVNEITRLQILELPLRVHVASEAEKPAEKTSLSMAYLREGITWIPEYSLKILDDKTAELTLRGTLVNEAEDLIHTDVQFVVGVPHFVHTQFLAPVAVGQMIRTIGTAVVPSNVKTQIMNRAAIANNAMMAQQLDNNVLLQAVPAEEGKLKQALGNLPQLEGPGAGDYTVYTRKDLTVRRGERAIVTLFVKRIPYGHIYRWSPPAAMEHNLVLQNDTDTAWTTGPCLALSGDRPLSEDLIKYTPKGGKAELPVTTAINIAHDKTEREVDRKFKAHSPADKVFYDLVTLEGELRLKNFEKTPATLHVHVSVQGKPIEASDDGRMSIDSTQLKLLERAGAIRWDITLKPDESKTLKYRYERYVPSN
ncbi:MAG TPA: hypothetical protein VHB77_07000, partial [Planctomycetaceae bacterium]|nr:hypothetical protein [Planctomycetaceae bacterium]